MNKYVAFLRGINVSGTKKIKMAELREQLAEIDLVNVQTYIQSGNVVFESESEDANALADLIHDMIRDRYGFEVPTMVKTKEEIAGILEACPYLKGEEFEEKKIYFTMLGAVPEKENVEAMDVGKYAPELAEVSGANLYFYAAKGAGKAKMGNNFFESKLKVSATTRNLRTMRKMLDLLS